MRISSKERFTSGIAEAASIKFTAGGPVPVSPGDIITKSSDTKGKVIGYPILVAGSWAGEDASGIILLNNVTGTFTAGEAIYVVGSNTTMSVTECRDRDNYIRAYYGTAENVGSPSSDPFPSRKSDRCET